MADAADLFVQNLESGGTVGEALAAAAPVPPAPPAEAAAAPVAAPAADPFESYLANTPPELRDLARPALEQLHKDLSTRLADKEGAARQLDQLRQALSLNPRGAIAYFAEHFRVPVRFDDGADGRPATHRDVAPPPEFETEVAGLKQRIVQATSVQEQVDAIDTLARTVARRESARIGAVERDQLAIREQMAREDLKARFPDVNVEAMWPQIMRRSQAFRERPYLFPDEAFMLEVGPQALAEVRRLKQQGARTAAPADRARVGVAGPGGAAPGGMPFDPYKLTDEQLIGLMGVAKTRD